MEVNNAIYDDLGHAWWDDDGDGNLVSLRYLSNPVKFNYIHSIVMHIRSHRPDCRTLLDIGCGGGYLSEELAKIDLDVTGLDPSPASIEAARIHAEKESLAIEYCEGYGEKLPFESNRFDFACCCDVLEHVDDFSQVIKEISRVLKPGGVFFYDTINRTLISKFVMINIMQEWQGTAFLDPTIHVWDKFIKPQELLSVLAEHQLVSQELKGLSPGMNFIAHYFNLRKRAIGKMSWQELGKRLKLNINRNTTCTYIGYAVKQPLTRRDNRTQRSSTAHKAIAHRRVQNTNTRNHISIIPQMGWLDNRPI